MVQRIGREVDVAFDGVVVGRRGDDVAVDLCGGGGHGGGAFGRRGCRTGCERLSTVWGRLSEASEIDIVEVVRRTPQLRGCFDGVSRDDKCEIRQVKRPCGQVLWYSIKVPWSSPV